jgi:ABC-type transport system substrate-binding protein
MNFAKKRLLLVLAVLAALPIVLAACSSDPEIVEVTRVVETKGDTVEVEVTREVKGDTIEVEVKGDDVIVEQTVVVKGDDVQVVVTATAIPTATALPIAALEPAPAPINPSGTLSVAVFNIAPGVGLGSAQAPVEAMQYWGVGEGLFAMDAGGAIINRLATGFTIASDLSYVDVDIRSGVKFHDQLGDFGELTVDDVVWNMNDANANTNATSIHGQAGDFAALFTSTEKIDDDTARFYFNSFDLRWNGNFLNEQAQGTAFFSKNAFDTMGESWMLENIVSTGPFKVDEWVQDDRAVISKVGYDHWRTTATTDTIRFVEVPEPSTRVALLRTGEVDVADSIPLKDIRPLAESGFKAESITRAGRVHEIIFSGNYWEANHAVTGEDLKRTGSGYCVHDLPWVGCNIEGKQPGDMVEARDVRWALAKAIDRELLADTILDGFGTVGSMEYIDTTAPWFEERWLIPYDPESAIEQMANTAWPTGKFTIGIWTGGELGGSSGSNAEINDAIAGMWLALWPDMDIQVFKSAYSIIRPGLVGRTNTIPYAGDCDEGSTTIPFDWPHGLTETSRTRGGFGCGIEIPEISDAFGEVSLMTDPVQRAARNVQMVDYLYDEMIFAGTVQVPTLVVYNPNSISGWLGTPSMFATMNEFESIELAR